MTQLFRKSTNTTFRVALAAIFLLPVVLLFIAWVLERTSYETLVDIVRDQPVPFSHEHHVRGLGLDCRYCHTAVEKAASAGLPPTQTCMNCHQQLYTESAMLAPVRDSYATGKPIHWTRVHDLPDFVFFNHSIHVNKGIGCVTCHGRVDRMPLMMKANTLQMEWCLRCHRAPEGHVRPRSAVFEMDGEKGLTPAVREQLAHAYQLKHKTDCWTCHR